MQCNEQMPINKFYNGIEILTDKISSIVYIQVTYNNILDPIKEVEYLNIQCLRNQITNYNGPKKFTIHQVKDLWLDFARSISRYPEDSDQ